MATEMFARIEWFGENAKPHVFLGLVYDIMLCTLAQISLQRRPRICVAK